MKKEFKRKEEELEKNDQYLIQMNNMLRRKNFEIIDK